MSESTQSEPVMDGSDDATEADKRAGLAAQVEQDHADESDAAKAGHLQDRIAEADVEPDAAADGER